MNKNQQLNALIIGVVIIISTVVTFFLLKSSLSLSNNLITLLVADTLIIFFLLRLENKITLIFLILFISSIGLLVFLSYKFNETSIYLSFLVATLFLLAGNNQIFIRKSYEESATEYQNKILDKQVEEVQNIYLTMRSWRHDYHNHLQKLKAHIMMDQIKEANQYLNELEIDLDNVNQLVESGNINLDAILNSKLSLAIKNNIDINYTAKVPKTLTISDIDLCVLIGNLIDNAVEACEKIKDNSSKFVRVYIGIFKKQLYISVANSTNEIIKKLDAEYISSKRGNHGHGLKRINNIVNKYDGFINRQNEPRVFASEVLLPL
ncbi:sensor histidine kinase [Candidatus Izimaplasma bacterium HR1]|jgi:sensor histidine kinase YesM|uniref:sensor histidine kinase n=1 Tax=Candidatus Izimoplasma sp. HR1 TaxID=1541959 RepID=UPI0009DEA947